MDTPRHQRRTYRKPALRGLGSMSAVTRKSGPEFDGSSLQRRTING